MTLELTTCDADVLATALRSFLGDLGHGGIDIERITLRPRLKKEQPILDSVLHRVDSVTA